jgi:hypothetical protein
MLRVLSCLALRREAFELVVLEVVEKELESIRSARADSGGGQVDGIVVTGGCALNVKVRFAALYRSCLRTTHVSLDRLCSPAASQASCAGADLRLRTFMSEPGATALRSFAAERPAPSYVQHAGLLPSIYACSGNLRDWAFFLL